MIPDSYKEDHLAHRWVGEHSLHSRMDKSHLIDHLQTSMEALVGMAPLPEDETDGCSFAVRWENVEQVANCYLLLKDISNSLPHVQAWVAGYWWHSGGSGDHWSGFYGCESEQQASSIAEAARAKQQRKDSRKPSNWQARFTDIAIFSCVRPTALPEEVIRGLYA